MSTTVAQLVRTSLEDNVQTVEAVRFLTETFVEGASVALIPSR